MLFKKKTTIYERSNVRYIEGTVAFSKVKLNTISFETDGVLIDTGAKSISKQFAPFFDQADLEKIVITHHHEDHTGAAAYLQKKYQIPILTHGMMTGENQQKGNYPIYRKIFWGNRDSFKSQPIGDTFTSRNAIWDVIETPGHAKDHLAFINRETGQLFSGDLFVTPKTKLVLREESIPTIIQSIERVLTYDFAEMFCCHAGFIENGRKALEAKLSYLKGLQEEVFELNKEGYADREIQKKLFKKKYPLTFFSGGDWDSLHIVRSILYDG